ncbi:MAG TPA: DUF1116 domain-containing protein, partial [Anaerolineales bacterium]|nr:DUF1116 domain-containing protein [Anaerolineales bacterium]
MAKINIDQANNVAVERMMSARPILTGIATARDVVPNMEDNLLLHAGPPVEWEQMSGPMQGAVIGGLIFEGLVDNEIDAVSMVEAGEVKFAPCHEHSSVGPMAGVTTASMKVYEVNNTTHGNVAYSNLNEGYGKVLRYGAFSEDVITKLRWMNDVLAPVLSEALAKSENGIDVRQLLSEALHMGDEGHNRNKAGSILYTAKLAPMITKLAVDSDIASEALQFLADNALSVLNPVMAACKSMADAAHGVEGSTLMTIMARNGTE